jgi:hypothetical protein
MQRTIGLAAIATQTAGLAWMIGGDLVGQEAPRVALWMGILPLLALIPFLKIEKR